jgi:hypothetical protein
MAISARRRVSYHGRDYWQLSCLLVVDMARGADIVGAPTQVPNLVLLQHERRWKLAADTIFCMSR